VGSLKSAFLLILACLVTCSCSARDGDPVSLAFYEALKISGSSGPGSGGPEARAKALGLFAAALQSPEPLIRDASAERLILALLEGDVDPESVLKNLTGSKIPAAGYPAGGGQFTGERSLLAAAFYALGRYGETLQAIGGVPQADRSLWERALFFLAEPGLEEKGARDKALAFFFNELPGDEAAWAREEIRRRSPGFLSPREDTILEARFATARGDFGGGLDGFRGLLAEGPGIFLRYPGLVNDLGRCFQFAQSGTEGADLFLKWEEALGTGTGEVSPEGFRAEDVPLLRYRLLYFAGRITRQRGQYSRSRGIFSRALETAPDNTQKDACIWYILDTALTEEIPGIVPLVVSYIPRWHDDASFSDILDRLAYRLVSENQWESFPEILSRIEGGGDRVSIAKYAYIAGRSITLGYAPLRERKTEDFFRTAYQAGEGALYYRALSAFTLGLPFLDLPASPAGMTEAFPHPRETAFLLGFFEAGIGGQVLPYLEKLSGDLSVPELRRIGEAMAEAGLYADLIRHVTAYMNREAYEPSRRDLELSHPRPFREMVEERSRDAGFPRELLWALVRTESAFQADIVSWAGAVGLTQLMPPTARDMADRIKRRGGPDFAGEGEPDLRDPGTNLYIGAFYLDYLREHLGHPLLSILAYNGGMGRVRRWYGAAGNLPGDIFLETIEYRETREYGRKIVAAAAVYGSLYYDVNLEEFIADICK
jgi:soluble lytic murein transglycosylase